MKHIYPYTLVTHQSRSGVGTVVSGSTYPTVDPVIVVRWQSGETTRHSPDTLTVVRRSAMPLSYSVTDQWR